MNDLTVTFKEYAAGAPLALDLIGTFAFALSGAVVVVIGHLLAAEPTGAAIPGAAFCLLLRLFASRRGWQLHRSLIEVRRSKDD